MFSLREEEQAKMNLSFPYYFTDGFYQMNFEIILNYNFIYFHKH